MTFSIYLPELAYNSNVPVLYWLSGLTCTDENFVTKSGVQRYAAEYGLAVVAPDTSPRGECVPDDSEAAYDFGLGAGIYLDATQPPWNQHYQMYSYITEELPELINTSFSVNADKKSIFGHSMGGHGALTIYLKNHDKYKSVSAFSPVVAPMQCPWGEKAFSNYLGADRTKWKQYDATELLRQVNKPISRSEILIDQGLADQFLLEQLKPELFEEVATEINYPLKLRHQEGYDHSYYFIATFMHDHIQHHAQYLNN